MRLHTLSLIALCASTLLGCDLDLSQPDPVVIDEDELDPPERFVAPSFDPTQTGFYATPWPADARLKDGRVDLSNMPSANRPIIRTFREVIEQVRGYSLMPVTYIHLDAPIVNFDLPSPGQTITARGGVQLVELGEGCGNRVPLHVDVDPGDEGDSYILPNTLRAVPLPGFVLKPATTYALILRTRSGATAITRPEAFESMLNDAPSASADATWHASLQPLRECLPNLDMRANQIALATVFTTQDPISETLKMRDVAMTKADAPRISDWEEVADTNNGKVYSFTYLTPIFQRGNSPYNRDGDIELDAQGEPIIQRYEQVYGSVIIPKRLTRNPAPVLLWSDGTGASQLGHVRDNVIQLIAAQGFVVVSFTPQFHDKRATPGSDEVLSTFNYLNPASGRTVFRQQAIDVMYLTRVIREALPSVQGVPALDLNSMVYGGHSQGALVGAIVAGITDTFRAYALNGVGSYLTSVITYRKDYLDIEQTIRTLIGVRRELDDYHLVLQIAQLGAEPVDPQNYAHRWRGTATTRGSHVLLTNGGNDATTSRIGMSALTIAGDAAPIAPAGWSVDPTGTWSRLEESTPIVANRRDTQGNSLTVASLLIESQGHFSIYRDTRAASMFVNFWAEAASSVPTIR
jgi:hypothetical protein